MIETVIKRDGTEQPFEAEKLNKWAEYAAKLGGSWSEIAQKTFKNLPSKVSSKEIHQTMIDVCLEKQDITHSRVAARLEIGEIKKSMAYLLQLNPDTSSFQEIMNVFEDLNIWDSGTLPEYNPRWEAWYDELKTVHMEFWRIKQWSDKYAQKIEGNCIETPAIGYMGIALALFGDSEKAYKFAKALTVGQIGLPTPALNGLRNGDWDTISCCVISAEDNTDSIGVANWIAYKMTSKKSGIGIEYTTRSKDDPVKGGRVDHLGKHPIFKALDREVKVLTQITRGGNATVTVLAIDPEIEDIILWKSQRTDIETRIDKLDYEFGYNEAFLDAVVKDHDWHLFSYLDAPAVYEAFYKSNSEMYNSIVRDHIARGVKHKTIKARDLLKRFLTIRQETGRFYDNNLTRTNTHTPFIDTIRQSNLCVAPETQILTRDGYVAIAELEDEVVDVWNGKEFSSVNVKKTGTNEKLVKVVTDSGYEIDCTPYHKFYVSVGYKKPCVEKRAHELVSGDKLIKFDLPVIEGDMELDKPYENGFYSGDGCLTREGQRIYLYGEKRKLENMFDVDWVRQDKYNRQYGHYKDLQEKFFVPSHGYSIKSRLKWLAGYLDADGCVYRNGDNEQLVATSIEKNFLREVQMMLQTLGVSAKVKKCTDAGFHDLPANDGSGEFKKFWCEEAYRLIITSCDVFNLLELGLELKRLKVNKRRPQRDAKRFVIVEGVEDLGRVDDTFCFNEPKRHMGMFNGILTGQCEEIALPTKAYPSMEDVYQPVSKGETAFCSLSAINVSLVSFDEYEEIAELTLEAVDIMIDNAPMMSVSMRNDIMKRRSVGIGITGLASRMYKEGYDYDGSDESLNFVQKLAEYHYYYLLKASQKLSARDGYSVEGIKKDWLPIDTAINKPIAGFDWGALRGKPRKHSVLVAHMPTESSSLLSGSSNSIYPVRKKVINKRSRRGIVQFICDEFDESKYMTAWQVDNIVMSKYYGRIQDNTDQAISADSWVDPARYEDEKVPMSYLMKHFVAHARLGNKTKYYVNTKDDNGGSFQDMAGCHSGEIYAENFNEENKHDATSSNDEGVSKYLRKENNTDEAKKPLSSLDIEEDEDGCKNGCKL